MAASKKATTSGPSKYGAALVSFEHEPAFTPSRESGLDLADLKIMDILSQNGRTNNRSMTAQVGLTEETVAARIRQMIDREMMAITAVFDWAAAGFNFDLWLGIKCYDSNDVAPVASALAEFEEVVIVDVVLGTVDVVAHLLVRDGEGLLDFLAGKLTTVEGIAHTDVSVGVETVKFFFQFARIPVDNGVIELPDPVVEMDELDWSIVDALVRNGRVSNREIARSLGVSDGTIRTRLHRLEDEGLIRVRAQVDPLNTGMIGARALVALSVQGADARDVARELAAMPEVLTVSLVTGGHDIICYVVASSRDQIIDITADRIRPVDGVRRLDVYDIIQVVKSNSHWARW